MSLAGQLAHHDPMAAAVKAHVSGDVDAAERLYRRVLEERPNHNKATLYLGVLLFQTGRKSGLHLIKAATDRCPEDAEAWANLGNAYRQTGQMADAVRACEEAVRLDPRLAAAHCTLSACLRFPGTLGRSIAAAQEAVRLQPNLAEAHTNLGHALLESGQVQAAMAAFRQATYVAPRFADAWQGLIFASQYSDRHSRLQLRDIAQGFANVAGRVAPSKPSGPLRTLGFLSGDFRHHPVAHFLEPLLKELALTPLKVVLVSSTRETDAVTERLRSLAQEWLDVSELAADEAAAQIRASGVDVLFDLAGHTADNRWDVLAQRPAAVQVSWLGYSGTTGHPQIDFLLADESLVPNEHEDGYTERIHRLPVPVFCFDGGRIANPVSDLPSQASGQVTFGCFNNVTKLSPSCLATWRQLLESLPDSQLLLKSAALAECEVAKRIRSAFGGVQDRVTLEGWTADDAHYGAYARVDIALDPFPYTGATTTCEALFMGVPVVTLAGDRYSARMSTTILHAIGADWVASNPTGYIETARNLATDLPRLAGVRRGLRRRVEACRLCGAKEFASSFVAAAESMWSAA